MNIVAMGSFPPAELWDHVLELAGGTRVLVDHSASPEYEGLPLELQGDFTHFSFYPWPPDDLREQALASDAILVCGGNTANMLAVWRVHGFDRILREAWEAGVLLCGWSAGMICWFEAGVTDSFGPQLEGLRDGLGFFSGSACPHYDGEELRRPVYQRLVAEGFPPGIAVDDDVGLRYRGTELAEVVSAREGATAYHVEAGTETALESRLL
jgi:dipeptidase E